MAVWAIASWSVVGPRSRASQGNGATSPRGTGREGYRHHLPMFLFPVALLAAIHAVTQPLAAPTPTTLSRRYASAIKSCTDHRKALRLFNSMKEKDEHCRCLTIASCGRAKAWETALSLISPEAGVGSYTAAISACGRARQWRSALRLLAELQRSPSIQPTLLTYTAAITACGRARQWSPALDLIDELMQTGMRPSPSVTNAALVACERAGEWEAAVKLLEQMNALGATNRASLDTVVRACTRSGRFAEARRLLANSSMDGSTSNGALPVDTAKDAMHIAHLSGLRRVAGHGAGARTRAKNTRWALGVFSMPSRGTDDGEPLIFEVALQPDRAAGRNCLKLVVLEQATGRKVAFLLLENSGVNCAGDVHGDGHRSALRGLRIDDELRGRGMAKRLVAIWLQLCIVAGVTPHTGQINKPILSHVLTKHFGFVPEGGVVVQVSDATRRRDCIVERSASQRLETTHVQTCFRAPRRQELDGAVRAALATIEFSIEPDAVALRRALVGKQLGGA